MTITQDNTVVKWWHDKLVEEGAQLIDISVSGSRYYRRPSGRVVRFSDHAPNEATRAYLEKYTARMVDGYESIRIDQFDDRGDPRVEHITAPTFGEQLDIPQVDPSAITFKTIPEPGFHTNISEAEYHGKWEACSNSLLHHMRRSASHCRWAMQQGYDTTESKEFGSALHLAILQPERFDAETLEGETKGRNTKKNEVLAAANPGKIILGPDGKDEVLQLADRVMKRRAVRQLIESPGDAELSMVWDHVHDPDIWTDDDGEPLPAVRCKGRVDKVADDFDAMVDLKTTLDASPEAFAKSVYEWGYYRQAPMYLWGAAALNRSFDHFVFIAIEKVPPFEVALYRINDDLVEIGDQERQKFLAKYAECMATGFWPGYSNKVEPISVPAWALGKIDRID